MRLSGGTDYKSTDSRSTLGGHQNCRTAVNIPKSSLEGRVSWLRCRQGRKREPPQLRAAPATPIAGDLRQSGGVIHQNIMGKAVYVFKL